MKLRMSVKQKPAIPGADRISLRMQAHRDIVSRSASSANTLMCSTYSYLLLDAVAA